MLLLIEIAPLYLLALGAGSSFVFQQAVNANRRFQIGSTWWAGCISYAGGTLCRRGNFAQLTRVLDRRSFRSDLHCNLDISASAAGSGYRRRADRGWADAHFAC